MNKKPFTEIAMILLVVFAAVGVPVQRRVIPVPPAADTTPGDLLNKVAPVAVALANASDVDRAVWAEVWEKAAKAAEAEDDPADPLFRTTKDVRAFTVAAADVAWKRLAGVKPGEYPLLQQAIESFMADPKVIGKDDVIVDAAFKAQYAAACRALAYAGRKRG